MTRVLPGQEDWLNRRDVGIERAERKALRECGDNWTRTTAEFLRNYALTLGKAFVVEEARADSTGIVEAPTNSKAWGAAVQLANRKGWIKRVGYRPTQSSNGSPKCLWASP